MFSLRVSLVAPFALLLFTLLPALGFAQSPIADDGSVTLPKAEPLTVAQVPPLKLVEPMLGEPKQGSLLAEVATAMLGEALGITLTGAALVRTWVCDRCLATEDGQRMTRALRYTPSPTFDRKNGVAGLSISGSF